MEDSKIKGLRMLEPNVAEGKVIQCVNLKIKATGLDISGASERTPASGDMDL